METKLQTTENKSLTFAVESELKHEILKKIAQTEDVEQVQKLTKLLFEVDKSLENVKINSLSNEEKIKHSVQARRIDLAKQSVVLLSGIGITYCTR